MYDIVTIAVHESLLRGRVAKELESKIHPSPRKDMDHNYVVWKLGGKCSNSQELSKCDLIRIGMNVCNLKQVGLWPVTTASEKMTLGQLLTEIYTLEYYDLTKYKGECTSCTKGFERKAKKLAESAETWFSGLCLDCVKYGNGSNGTTARPACRMKHDEQFLGIRTSDFISGNK